MIIASNFKLNHTRASTREFIEYVDSFISENNIAHKAYAFPPFSAFEDYSATKVTVGAQDGYFQEKGSFTGEMGPVQFAEFNINTILIGHSERRHVIGESQELIAQKYAFYKALGYEIFYCIGEPLEVKNKGLEATLEYNFAQLEGIDIDYDKLVVAYEPVWAIGTGVSATNEEIEKIHAELRKTIKRPILYGGSVKAETIGEVCTIPNVDGALIGTASWDKEAFCKMLKI